MSYPVEKVDSKGDLEGKAELKHEELIDERYSSEQALIESAMLRSEEETKLGFKGTVKLHYKAALWSMALSLAFVMEGMDVGLVNNFFGQPGYKAKFGNIMTPNGPAISATWQAAINNGQQAGAVLGLLLNGWAQSKYGSRRVYMVAQVMMICTIFILFFAQNVEMLLAGNLICGIPWGIFQTVTTTYAAEIAPLAMRGYLTSWVSMCWGTGSFLAAVVLRGSLQLTGSAQYKVPYGLQWVWPVPLFIVAYFCPESPWYLVRVEKYEQAEKALYKLTRPGYYTPETMKAQLAYMKYTNEKEKVDAANSSYFDCFRGNNLRRTEIVCLAFLIQTWNGQPICSYATIFLQAAGMATTQSFNYSMGIQSSNIVATGIAIYLMGRLGRRTFMLSGLSGIATCMLVIGIMGVVSMSNAARGAGVGAMMVLINLTFKLSLGPAVYTIIGEIPSSRVRAQSIVLARTTYILGNLVNGQLIPRQLQPAAWNWGAKSGFYWLGLCLLGITYIYFRLPETKGRSFLEIDHLFAEKVPARKFKGYHLDLEQIRRSDKDNAFERVAEADQAPALNRTQT